MRINTRIIFSVLGLLMLGLFIGCDVPISLGARINTEVPIIKIHSDPGGKSMPGSYFQGSDNIVLLDVMQEFGIDYVYMTIEYYDLSTKKTERKTVMADWDSVNECYSVNIDTIRMNMDDGKITTWVTAVDISGKKTTTTEMVYIVKNNPPQIEMTIPLIKDEFFDDYNLNTLLPAKDPVYLGFDLMGLASDTLGIAEGYPKIMFWPASHPEVDENGIPTDAKFGTWRSAVVPNPGPGLLATRFSWSLVELVPDPFAEGGFRLPEQGSTDPWAVYAPGSYRFRVMTKDLYGKENYYPNRTDNSLDLDPEEHPNKYIEISLVAPDMPIITINRISSYYNKVGHFEVDFQISSQNGVAAIQAWTASKTDGTTNKSTVYENSPYVTQTGTSGGGYTYDYTLSIDPNEINWYEPEDGNLFLFLSAVDNKNTPSPSTYRNFIYDINPPDVSFDRPATITVPYAEGIMEGLGGRYSIYYPTGNSPKWVTGQVSVGGISKDDFGISKVEYYIGDLGDDDNGSDRTSIYKNAAWIDTRLNTSTPAAGWSGSIYAWTFTEDFNNYKTAHPTWIQESDDFNILGKTPGLTNYETLSSAFKQRFYLPFYVRVFDLAGNYHVAHYKLCIDPDLDIPQVDINYPVPKEIEQEWPMVGGEVRLSGIASDNNWVHSVLVRIKKDGDTNYYIPTGISEFTDYPASYNTGDPRYDTVDTEGWFKASKIGDDMVIGWFCNINGDNKLDPKSGDEKVAVKIEVRAIDTKDSINHAIMDTVGPAAVLDVYFCTGVPTLSTPKISKDGVETRDYYEGIRSSGKFRISMIVDDDDELTTLRARINNSPYVELINKHASVTPAPASTISWTVKRLINTSDWEDLGLVPSDRDTWVLEIEIDSTRTDTYYTQYLGYGKTGSLLLELTAEDNSSPAYRSNASFNIGVDNFYPVTELATPINASGTDFLVQGSAKDYGNNSGSLQGLERVLVYFEEAVITYPGDVRTVSGKTPARYLNPRGIPVPSYNNPASASGDTYYNTVDLGGGLTYTYTVDWKDSMPAMVKYPNVRDMTPGKTNITDGPTGSDFLNFPLLEKIYKGENIGDVWESPHAIVIDNQELGAEVDRDYDGTFGEVWDGLVDKEWGARLDTTLFSDGPLIVHYIVMDQAGNAAHYQKDIFIENNKPVIKSINLGTSIDGSTNRRFMDHEFPVGTTTAGNSIITFDPSFRIRNNTFALNLETESGNGDKHYKVSYVTPSAIGSNAATMSRGEVVTILTSGTTDWQKFGAPNNIVGTTFVASGPGDGNGTVTKYTTVRETEVLDFGAGVNDITNELIFWDSDFGTGTNQIKDSDPKSNGEIQTHNQRYFIIKVYDSTVPGTPLIENDQLAHAVLVAVDIDNKDEKKPTIEVADFGKEFGLKASSYEIPIPTLANDGHKELKPVTDYNRNIVMTGGTRQGYVQYKDDWDSAFDSYTGHVSGAADISGKVIFMGRAEDNQRITSITATIPGYNGGKGVGVEFDIAVWSSGSLKSANSNTIAQVGSGSTPWAFEAVDEFLTLEYGHVLNWRFAWDSSTITETAVSDVDIVFGIKDATGNENIPDTDNTIKVDIVPYITDIVTGLSGAYQSASSAFSRSARGWYPVRENEAIIIKGFNLMEGSLSTSGTLNPVVRLGGTGSGSDGVQLTPIADGSGFTASKSQIRVNIGTTAVSGPLVVTVSGITSINNFTNKDIPYNQEPNNVNNNKLNNNRNMYVWNNGYLLNESSLVTSPFFRMDPKNAGRYLAFGWYGQPDSSTTAAGTMRIMINNGTTLTSTASPSTNKGRGLQLATTNNRYLNTTLAIGGSNDWYVAASNQTQGTQNFVLYTSDGGTPGTVRARAIGDTAVSGGADPNKYLIPRIFIQYISNTLSRVLMSYHRSDTDAVLFRYGGRNGSSSNTFNGGIPASQTATPSYTNEQTISTGTYKGSVYTAVGALSNGRPVIAFYDEASSNLVFAWNSVAPTSTTWGTNVYPTSYSWTYNIIPNADGSSGAGNGRGDYVDLAVDANDNVHLAFYDRSNGGLYYMAIPSPSGTPVMTGAKPVRVDTFLAAGTNIMLNLRTDKINGTDRVVPYISYFHGSFANTKNSIRVAWPKKFPIENGTDEQDMFTGAWEVMTVPALNTPLSTEIICNGVPYGDGSWMDAYSGTGSLAKRTTTDIKKSILVGYMTSAYYEGAILNGDLTTLDLVK